MWPLLYTPLNLFINCRCNDSWNMVDPVLMFQPCQNDQILLFLKSIKSLKVMHGFLIYYLSGFLVTPRCDSIGKASVSLLGGAIWVPFPNVQPIIYNTKQQWKDGLARTYNFEALPRSLMRTLLICGCVTWGEQFLLDGNSSSLWFCAAFIIEHEYMKMIMHL